MKKKSDKQKEADRYIIEGHDASVEFEEDIMISGSGSFDGVHKILKRIVRRDSPLSTKPPVTLDDAIIKAEQEVQELNKASKLKHYHNLTERVQNAKDHLLENPDRFDYVTSELIDESWFDDLHGLRNARSKVFPHAALQAGYEISAYQAIILINLVKQKKSTSSVKSYKLRE